LTLVLGLPVGAVPQIESTYGGQSPWYSAELNAQANTGAAVGRGGLSNLLNPAGLAWSQGLQLDLGLSVVQHQEDRFMPVFDTFENRVIDMAIASNQKTWLGGGFGLALRNPKLPVVVGLSLAERYPFRYYFAEEIRDPSPFSSPRDRILEERQYEVTGVLRTVSCGLAGQLFGERLAVGGSVHYAFGERNERWLLRDNHLQDGDQSFEGRRDWDLSGFHATLGVQGRVSDRVTLGLAYETRLEVDGDHLEYLYTPDLEEPDEFSSRQALKYPAYWRAGLAFYPRNDPRTVLTADVVYADWTELEDSRLESAELSYLQEVVDVRIGVEHTFYNQARLRFGFRRYDSYADREGGNSVFSVGAGWLVAAGQMSVSLELNKLQSVLPHIFEYDPEYHAEDEARVDDRRVRLGLSWSRGF
jgi:opacity protein-like surface antigen